MGQSEYKNVSKKSLISALERLERKSDLSIEKSTKHTWKLSAPLSMRSYPVPVGHPEIRGWVVDDVVKWLVSNDVCSKKEFNDLLRK
jgi:hypothetical protein